MSARSTGATTRRARPSHSSSTGSLFAPLAGLKNDLLKPGKRPAMRAGSALAAYMTVLFASFALWWGLSDVVHQAWSALIVTIVWAIVCVLLYLASQRPPVTRAPKS